jgi:hypothetical protein
VAVSMQTACTQALPGTEAAERRADDNSTGRLRVVHPFFSMCNLLRSEYYDGFGGRRQGRTRMEAAGRSASVGRRMCRREARRTASPVVVARPRAARVRLG